MDWYIERDGKRFGPISFNKLADSARDGRRIFPENLAAQGDSEMNEHFVKRANTTLNRDAAVHGTPPRKRPRAIHPHPDVLGVIEEINNQNFDAIIVGSGPGGATLARELARAGKKVVVLEYGKDHRDRWYYGTVAGPFIYTDGRGFLKSKEGVTIVRPMLTGGATNMFASAASGPPEWWFKKTGIDIQAEINQTITELGIMPLPEYEMGAASQRIGEAGRDLGMDWQPQDKFINSNRCFNGLDCGDKCMFGCRCGGKWTANDYLDQAIEAGATVITECNVERVKIEDGVAIGVEGRIRGIEFSLNAKTIIVCAGGIGTPRILQNSGIYDVGDALGVDTTYVVYGVIKDDGNTGDPPMTVSYCDDENGLMYSTLTQPWGLFALTQYFKGWRHLAKVPKFPRMLGIMVKIKEGLKGYVAPHGEISMPLTSEDHQRANIGYQVAKNILLKAGCEGDSIFWNPPRGTHPCSSVRIGQHLDHNLQTHAFDNLYVSDASTFPLPLVRPPTLTIIGLSKRLAKHLTATKLATERPQVNSPKGMEIS